MKEIRTEKGRPEKRSLREELVQAGAHFLSTGRLRDLSMRKIAAMCHVTPHAIYNHFKNKDDLIRAINDFVMQEMNTFAIQTVFAEPGDFSEKIFRLLSAYLELYDKYPYYLTILDTNLKQESYYSISTAPDGSLTCKSKHPGFPELKMLNYLCNLSPTALLEFLKGNPSLMAQGITPHSELTLQEDNPAACLGQILLLAFVHGILYKINNGTLDGDKRDDTLRPLIAYLFQRIF